MATISCNKTEFNAALCKFNREIGDRRHSQASITGLFHGVSLHYLGLKGVTDEELDTCAMMLKIAISGAHARGWEL